MGNTSIKNILMGVEVSGNSRAAIKMSKGHGQCKVAGVKSLRFSCASKFLQIQLNRLL